MSTAHQSRIEELFLAAMDLPPAQRAMYLDVACGGDVDLRREVETLLGHAEDDGFMDSKVAPGRGLLTQLGAAHLKSEEPLLPADRQIGPYEILGVLGAGGMGVVYVAQQARPKRTVAIKVMRRVLGGVSGAGGQKLMRRFEHEAEVLGRLQHPGIAQVYEAGTYTTAGETHPYIAMELIQGQPLLAYATSKGLPTGERLRLFAMVCDAVQHAHRNGIIHRDLKPANILVDHSGQPKILDFGVARVTDREAAVTTAHTAIGQLIGTLPYMSPEQVLGNQEAVDTRSDVYALGVVLYELLTGRLPYDLSSRSLPEAARMIRDEEPARLSTVSRVFRGDVDTIVSKSLAKDRERRYQSASDLGDDVRRFLDGQPIAVRRDSSMYILGKQLRRYRGLVALGAFSMLAVLTLAVFSTIQAMRASTAAGQERMAKERAEVALADAQRERGRADENANRLARQLDASGVERGRLSGLTGSLGVAEDLIWPAHLRDPGSRHTFYALWELYMRHPLLATVPLPGARANWLAASPSGRQLVTTVDEKRIVLIDATTATVGDPWPEAPSGIAGLAFIDEDRIVVGDSAGALTAYDTRTREPVARIEFGAPVRCVAARRDGSEIAVGLNAGGIRVLPAEWARSTAGREAVRSIDVAGGVFALAYSPDGRDIAAAGSQRQVFVFRDGEPLRTLSGHTDWLYSVCFTADGTRVLSGSNDRSIRVWSVATGETERVLEAGNGFVRPLLPLPDGRVVSGGWWRLIIWNPDSTTPVRSFPLPIGLAAVVPGPGQSVWTVDGSTLRLWDLATKPRIVSARPETPHSGRTTARWSGDASQYASVDSDGWLRVFGADGSPRGAMKLAERLRTVAWQPGEPLIAAGATDDRLSIVRASEGGLELVSAWEGIRSAATQSFEFAPDGRTIAVSERGGGFSIRTFPAGEVVRSFPAHESEAIFVRYSRDGRLLVTGNRGGLARLWRVEDGALLHTFTLPTAPWAAVFNDDASRLLIGTWEKLIHEYDVATGQRLRSLAGHQGFIHDLTFRTNEAMILASSAADGTIRLWDLSRTTETNVMTIDIANGYDAMCLQFNPRRPELLFADGRGNVGVLLTRYFNRHIGGNYRYQLDRHRAAVGRVDDSEIDKQLEILERNFRQALTSVPPSR